MNRLEQRIADAIIARLNDPEPMDGHFAEPYARIAAKIALELAEKAFHTGWETGYAVAYH